MITYEQYLDADKERAFLEGSMHFEEESLVQKTLKQIAHRLDELEIPYAIAGAMALFYHGYRRFTEDVDILVSPSGLKKIHDELEGLGYKSLFTGSKNLRDTERGVKIDFLVAGGYPGDGKPKPVRFPEPQDCRVSLKGMSFVSLPKLIDLKLASGTAPGRRKDLSDVQEAIKYLGLPREYSNELDPSVRALFCELWDEAKNEPPQPESYMEKSS